MVVAWGSSGWRAASISELQHCLSLTLAGGGGVLATGCVLGGVAVEEGGDVGVAVARRVLPAGPLELAGLALVPIAVGAWIVLVAGERSSVACELGGLRVGEEEWRELRVLAVGWAGR